MKYYVHGIIAVVLNTQHTCTSHDEYGTSPMPIYLMTKLVLKYIIKTNSSVLGNNSYMAYLLLILQLHICLK